MSGGRRCLLRIPDSAVERNAVAHSRIGRPGRSGPAGCRRTDDTLIDIGTKCRACTIWLASRRIASKPGSESNVHNQFTQNWEPSPEYCDGVLQHCFYAHLPRQSLLSQRRSAPILVSEQEQIRIPAERVFGIGRILLPARTERSFLRRQAQPIRNARRQASVNRRLRHEAG